MHANALQWFISQADNESWTRLSLVHRLSQQGTSTRLVLIVSRAEASETEAAGPRQQRRQIRSSGSPRAVLGAAETEAAGPRQQRRQIRSSGSLRAVLGAAETEAADPRRPSGRRVRTAPTGTVC